MVAGLLLYHTGEVVKPPYREATAILQEEWQAGDLILHTSDGSYLPALRYLDQPEQVLLAGDPDPRKPEFVYEALGGAVWSRERAIERAERLWLVVALEHSVEWQQEQVRQFEQKLALQARYDVNGIIILLYEPASSATVE
jgi:hypothetical protein